MSLQVDHLDLEDRCAGLSSGHGDVHVASHLADGAIVQHQHVNVNCSRQTIVVYAHAATGVPEKPEEQR